MRSIYFDCYSGVSGDMILGALLDLGVDRERWLETLQNLPVSGFSASFSRVTRGGISALRVEIQCDDPQPHRSLKDIEAIIADSGLSDSVKTRSLDIFRTLAAAEARVHGVGVEEVHFHEVGAVDAIVDVVGACLALEMLGVQGVYASPVGVGQGVASAAHGPMSLPPPATLEILRGVPLHFTGIETELATPTGAAILKTLARFEPPEAAVLASVGVGAGAKVIPGMPNVLRAICLEASASVDSDRAILLETNIDNLNPELYPHVIDRLLEEGAFDAYLVPVIMKKGRPGVVLSVLSSPEIVERLQEVIYDETSTLGIRRLMVDRVKLPRREILVPTELGEIRGKESRWQDRVRVTPEYEDCRRIARERDIPLVEVYAAFNRAVTQKSAQAPENSTGS